MPSLAKALSNVGLEAMVAGLAIVTTATGARELLAGYGQVVELGDVPAPQAAIERYLAEHNTKPMPFVWTADPDVIIAAAKRGYQTLDSIR